MSLQSNGSTSVDIGSNGTDNAVSHKSSVTKKRPAFLQDLRGSKTLKAPGIGSISKKDRYELNKRIADIESIDANDLRDPNWEDKNRASVVEKATLTAHLEEVSKDNKKKHQINWLAMDVRDKELQLLEKSAAKKSNQRSKTLKYGW